jgi:hypothetical protein
MVPARQLGTVYGDETGTFRATGITTSLGGLIVGGSVVGTAKLNKDCTGTITYAQTINGQPGPPINITFVVSEEGNRIDGLIIDPGNVMSCVLKRISNDAPPAATPSAAKQNGDQLASRGSQPRERALAAVR